jgi:hypothetical protein
MLRSIDENTTRKVAQIKNTIEWIETGYLSQFKKLKC